MSANYCPLAIYVDVLLSGITEEENAQGFLQDT
jgi:hypothetical protein